jgi:hypothetical protein
LGILRLDKPFWRHWPARSLSGLPCSASKSFLGPDTMAICTHYVTLLGFREEPICAGGIDKRRNFACLVTKVVEVHNERREDTAAIRARPRLRWARIF